MWVNLSAPFVRHPWMDDALCTQVDPDLFFPQGKGSVTRSMAIAARGVCCDCTVRAECLQMAMDDPHLEGVWGGRTHEERRQMRKEVREAS